MITECSDSDSDSSYYPDHDSCNDTTISNLKSNLKSNLIRRNPKRKKKIPNKKSKDCKKNKKSNINKNNDTGTRSEALQRNGKDKIFYDIINYINANEPKLFNILNDTNLLLPDRSELFELYEIFKQTPNNTDDYLKIKKQFNQKFLESQNKFLSYQNFSSDQHLNIKQQIQKIQNINPIDIQYQIITLNTSLHNKNIIYKKYTELQNMDSSNEEYPKIKNWLNWSLSLPYDNIKILDYTPSQLTVFLQNIKIKMDTELYGMENVKDELLVFISSKILYPNTKKCSLALIGIPGVGKTRIARLLSSILNFPFHQISFGGVTESEFLKGYDYTYIGSQPGEIVKGLCNMKYKNGIMFFDEFEKISSNKNIISTLLHITDPSQNFEYKDNFLDNISIDLSNIWFIYSMNSLPNDLALSDRIYTINVSGYSITDKINIVKNYLFPNYLKNINHDKSDIIISYEISKFLVLKISPNNNTGVRSLEQVVNSIVNKINFIVNHNSINVSFKINSLKYPVKLSQTIINNLLP
jgi:ATP-dependent Lon protease